MALYCYVKTYPHDSFLKSSLSYFLMTVGLFLISIVFYSIFVYKVNLLTRNEHKLLTPVNPTYIIEAKDLTFPLVEKSEEVKPAVGNVNYLKVKNWFPSAPIARVTPSKITHYTLSIPKLKIEKAVVEIGGEDLKKSLVHYSGTALPGEYGNTVIFGHSVLPVFYNPKDYNTIFSKIPTLQKGDEIFIDFDGIHFKYDIEDYLEIEPEEVEVLEQRFDQQSLSLITCVPPGTYRKRGIVKASLAKI